MASQFKKNISIKDIEELKQKLKNQLDKQNGVESVKPVKEQELQKVKEIEKPDKESYLQL